MKNTLLILIAALLSLISYAQTDTSKLYRSVNVHFYNTDSSIRFGGTLSIPVNQKIKHTVLLISGTGKQDRDGLMAGTKVFAEIAHVLSSAGIAVLRTDDRETGETTGSYSTSTTADFAADAKAAMAFLFSEKELHAKKIGLIGHSEGGAVVTMVAAGSTQVEFVISLSGLAAPGLEALLAQNEAIVNTTPGISDLKKTRLNALNKRMFETAAAWSQAPDSVLSGKLRAEYDQWRAADDSLMKGSSTQFADRIMYPIDRYIYQATGPWYRFHISYDPSRYLPLVKVPVLAINGAMDNFVPAGIHLPYFKKLITWKKGSLVETVVFPHTNHLLQYCETCGVNDFSKPGWHVSPVVLTKLTEWIGKLPVVR